MDSIHAEFVLQLDACSTEQNAQCEHHISPDQDTLATEWVDCMPPDQSSHAVWMNPPWGRNIGRFVERAYKQSQKHRLIVVCLLPACTDTRWWRDWVWKANEVRLVTGRLKFVRDDGHTGPATKGCAVVVFTPWGEGPPRVSLMERNRP
jgi:site-specific DNA-methyltransferase (adenine-specific)